MSTKLAPADRKQQILTAALAIAETVGYQNITREAIAERVGVSHSLVNLYFVVMAELKSAVIREAVRVRNYPVIAQGLVAKEPAAVDAAPILKRRALASLTA